MPTIQRCATPAPDVRWLDPALETAPPAERRARQEARLRAQVQYVYARSPFYRVRLDAAGVTPAQVQTLDDLPRLPFTSKADVKQTQEVRPPWGDLLAVPVEEALRIHLTSGSTGTPVAWLHTPEDWHACYHAYARALWAYGVRPADVVMPAFGFGPWIGFWMGIAGCEEIGCLLFPSGGYRDEQRLEALCSYPITVLGCTPSYAVHLADCARERGIDLRQRASVRISYHTGEPGASIAATRRRIEEAFGCETHDFLGLTEVGPWGFTCDARSGLVHLQEDHAIAEILDPETGRPVGPGEQGELVLTPLWARAMPLLRYRLGDVVRRADRACPCGRTAVALAGGVIARVDDMKKVRGVIVYPTRIEEVVRGFAEVGEYQVVLRRARALDEIELVAEPLGPGGDGEATALRGRLAEALRQALSLRVEVRLVAPGTLPRSDGKVKRLIDARDGVPF